MGGTSACGCGSSNSAVNRGESLKEFVNQIDLGDSHTVHATLHGRVVAVESSPNRDYIKVEAKNLRKSGQSTGEPIVPEGTELVFETKGNTQELRVGDNVSASITAHKMSNGYKLVANTVEKI